MIKFKTKEEKEQKIILQSKKKLNKKEKKYITKSQINKKIKNSQSFINTNYVQDKGIIYLKTGEVAKVLSVGAIDLSLSSSEQRTSFYSSLKYLYQIKDLDLRIYKLDEQINLNLNKDYINEMIEKYKDDEDKLSFLQERYSLLEN